MMMMMMTVHLYGAERAPCTVNNKFQRKKGGKKTNIIERKVRSGMQGGGWVGVGMSLCEKVCLQLTLERRGGRINFGGLGKAIPEVDMTISPYSPLLSILHTHWWTG